MELAIRPAAPADYARLVEIAAEGDFGTCDSAYLSFISANGSLLCAAAAREVVAYAGMVLVDEVAMVTDLFVAPTARGSGIGGRLLGELLDRRSQRMTFSAQNSAAQSAYRRVAMQPRGRMLYLTGSTFGGGAALRPGQWGHDRLELVDYFVARGATVTPHAVVQVNESGVEILRIDIADAIEECERLLSAFDPGVAVSMYVPESHALAAWLVAHDFVVTDHDLLFTTEGTTLPPNLAALHPGLA